VAYPETTVMNNAKAIQARRIRGMGNIRRSIATLPLRNKQKKHYLGRLEETT
jgi:hypothetical protein